MLRVKPVLGRGFEPEDEAPGAQPVLLLGYHKGSIQDPDDVVFDVISDVLSRGRASRLYKSLVKEQQIALNAFGFPGFPGNKYPNLMLFFSFPTKGHSAEDCERAIKKEIERLKTEAISEEELQKAKTRARADLIRSLGSNTGIAGQLTFYQAVTGDWRNLYYRLDRIDKVTPEDIQRVAKETFQPKNETVAVIESAGQTAETGEE